MSTDGDTDYYVGRAAQEQAMAQRATDEAVQELHRQMAALYEAKAGRTLTVVQRVRAN